MTITFKYKTVRRPDNTTVKTPSIPITVIGKIIRFDASALLDSGADISAIPKDMAELLGLDLNSEIQTTFGIGGAVDSIETTMSLIVEKGHEHYPLTIPVKVILGNYDFPILLGRTGFFDKFIICIDENNERVTLKKSLTQY